MSKTALENALQYVNPHSPLDSMAGSGQMGLIGVFSQSNANLQKIAIYTLIISKKCKAKMMRALKSVTSLKNMTKKLAEMFLNREKNVKKILTKQIKNIILR